MKLRTVRLAQQARLWIYTALIVLIMVRIWSGNGGLAEFVMFMLIGALFYSELCPVCGRLCWWEVNPLRRWPNALWIGPECRQQRCGDDGSPSAKLESR